MKKQNKLNEAQLGQLYRGILSLKSLNECKAFFRDLCTLSELQEMAERFEVARLIEDGLPYREIAHLTGVSTATVTRVAQWLNHGEGGYVKILNRLKP